MVKFEEGENIVRVVRRHYFVILPFITILVISSVAPIILIQFLLSDFLQLSLDVRLSISNFISEWKVFGYSIWLLILWVVFFIEWTDYYLDVWILTDRRIVDIEQKGFFNREVTSLTYHRIQDITVETRGIIETLFKFGTLHVQTAGSNREILIRDAMHPEEARSLMLSLQQKYRQKHNLKPEQF
jgi:membrane protein YdbS with pleckstrin-like domain